MPSSNDLFDLINNIHTTDGKKTILDMFNSYLHQAPNLSNKEQIRSLNFLLEFLDIANMNSLNLNFLQEVTGNTAAKLRDTKSLLLKSRYLKLLAKLPLHDQQLKEFVSGILLHELEAQSQETWYLEEIMRTLYWLIEHFTDEQKKQYRNVLSVLLENTTILPSTSILISLCLAQIKDFLLPEHHELLSTHVTKYAEEQTKRSKNALFSYITLMQSKTFPTQHLDDHVKTAIQWVKTLNEQGFIGYLFNVINSLPENAFIIVKDEVQNALNDPSITRYLGQGLKQELQMKTQVYT